MREQGDESDGDGEDGDEYDYSSDNEDDNANHDIDGTGATGVKVDEDGDADEDGDEDGDEDEDEDEDASDDGEGEDAVTEASARELASVVSGTGDRSKETPEALLLYSVPSEPEDEDELTTDEESDWERPAVRKKKVSGPLEKSRPVVTYPTVRWKLLYCNVWTIWRIDLLRLKICYSSF